MTLHILCNTLILCLQAVDAQELRTLLMVLHFIDLLLVAPTSLPLLSTSKRCRDAYVLCCQYLLTRAPMTVAVLETLYETPTFCFINPLLSDECKRFEQRVRTNPLTETDEACCGDAGKSSLRGTTTTRSEQERHDAEHVDTVVLLCVASERRAIGREQACRELAARRHRAPGHALRLDAMQSAVTLVFLRHGTRTALPSPAYFFDSRPAAILASLPPCAALPRAPQLLVRCRKRCRTQMDAARTTTRTKPAMPHRRPYPASSWRYHLATVSYATSRLPSFAFTWL